MQAFSSQSSFRKPYKMLVRSDGEHVKGKWVNGGEIEQTLMASIQPLSGAEMDRLVVSMQGRRVSSAVKIYTDQKLDVGGENTHNGTVILVGDERYEVISRAAYHSAVLSHYRYVAIRVK